MSKLEIRIEPARERPPGPLPDELGFGRILTGRMFTQRYTPEREWHDAVIGPYRPLPADPAGLPFHCGQMVFEGTKTYLRPDGDASLFRVERVNGGQPGPVAQRLYQALADIQYGRVRDPYGWTCVVSLRATTVVG